MHTLISFLGRQQMGYRRANYQFASGVTHKEKFFGLSLAKYIKPEKIILIGTTRSMWDVFFDDQHTDDSLLNLIDTVKEGKVTK